MVSQIRQRCIVQYLVLDVVAQCLEWLLIHCLQLVEQVGEQCECARVEGSFAQTLRQVCFARDVKLRFLGCADSAEEFDGVLVEYAEPTIKFSCILEIEEGQGVLYEHLMQHRIEEYFPKADILRDYEKEL